jgi:hypothetical protein
VKKWTSSRESVKGRPLVGSKGPAIADNSTSVEVERPPTLQSCAITRPSQYTSQAAIAWSGKFGTDALYKTHHTTFNEKHSNVVPNFIGGSLPRCDRDDREYYCATMLTLFKPWRSGEDMKSKDHSWDETFNAYDFTPRQLEIMKYFNIQYECNDAT